MRVGLPRRGSSGLGKRGREQVCGNGNGVKDWELTGFKAENARSECGKVNSLVSFNGNRMCIKKKGVETHESPPRKFGIHSQGS